MGRSVRREVRASEASGAGVVVWVVGRGAKRDIEKSSGSAVDVRGEGLGGSGGAVGRSPKEVGSGGGVGVVKVWVEGSIRGR